MAESLMSEKTARIFLTIMASGLSRRFAGENKLLADFRGEPLCRPVFRAAAAAERAEPAGFRALVVTASDEIAKLAAAEGLAAVKNDCPEEGQSRSLRLGIKAFMPLEAEDFLLFLPADQPFMTAGVLQEFCRAIRGGDYPLWRAWDGHSYGSPTAFKAAFAPELMELRGDQGGKILFKRYPDKVGKVLLELRSLWDVDTREALDEAIRRAEADDKDK